MDSKVVNIGTAKARQRTYYERFMETEGIPVVDGYGVNAVRNISLKAWKRIGCDGAYLQLRGLEGIPGVYVGKLDAGATTCLSAIFTRKCIYMLQGEGVAEIPAARSRAAAIFFGAPAVCFRRQ